MRHKNHIAKDLRTPKYRKRVVPDKKKLEDREVCRKTKTKDKEQY